MRWVFFAVYEPDLDTTGTNCICIENDYPEKAIEIAEKWVENYPGITRQSVFLYYLNTRAIFDNDNVLVFCPKIIEKNFKCRGNSMFCTRCRKDFWLEEVEQKWKPK